MDNGFRNCIIARLVILIVGLVLAIATAALFSIGLVPLLPAVFPFTAALGALLVLLIVIAVSFIQHYECARRCVLCIGLPAMFAALALVLLSLIAIATGITLAGDLAVVFVFLLALALWVSVIGFAEFMRCVAHREA